MLMGQDTLHNTYQPTTSYRLHIRDADIHLVNPDSAIVLLHGRIKSTQNTPVRPQHRTGSG